ncbi:30S ribosomal protein S21 [Candidatus Margulisiibacteriota bacterium]
MVEIRLRKDEPIDRALRKFKTQMKREGILDEVRQREFYEKPSQKKRKDLEKARRKEIRRKAKEE